MSQSVLPGINEGDEEEEALQPKWNAFRDIPVKQESGSQGTVQYIEISVKVMKVLAYIITFIVVLCGGVVGKAGFLLITSNLRPTIREACLAEGPITSMFEPLEIQRILWTWVLFFVLIIPDVGTLLRSARIVFFKNNEYPNFLHFFIVAFMESAHVIGVSMLAFEVLPKLDVVRGVMLTNAACFIPAVLQFLSRNTAKRNGLTYMILDGLAVFFQFTALVIWPLYDNSPNLAFIGPGLFLASCGWWLNYVPASLPRGRGIVVNCMRFLIEVKNGISENRMYYTYLVVSAWKILLYFGCMLAIMAIQDHNIQEFFDSTYDAFQVHHFNGTRTKMITKTTLALYANETMDFDSNELDWLWVAIATVGGSYLAYIFSKFACKILIQEVGLAVPNILVVPLTIIWFVIFDEKQTTNICFSQYFLPPYISWNIDLDEEFIGSKIAWIWLLWLISQVWLTFHIWSPQCQRLASTEKLFVAPMYSAFLIDQSICMNRRKDEEREEEEVSTRVPHLIACATMWHESKEEMLEMFKSIVRMDFDQCAHKMAKQNYPNKKEVQNNYYEFETQIFFDDAFNSKGTSVNQFVKDMVETLPESIREVYSSNNMKLDAPRITMTPYGGRLQYTLPGGTDLTVHLKNKQKIRHRKRWSQCMYMYYLLGYRLVHCMKDKTADEIDDIAHNTFLLALDGDIDFNPKAVLLLVDLMKKNNNLGAACGRIHPVGSGLMAWYQVFEYAIGHWLQKATEHMIGCVLCSPGCFSLFRGRALMDDNVMRTYLKNCDAAVDYVQYDQGEDRWLCTLLLQKGYRVEYSAASDAYTHCPENFNEFYNQRRRWVPSTMANILDLLGSYKRTIKVNSNISMPYIIYQGMLMGGTILGPGTIFLMLVGAFVAAFGIDNWTAFYYNLIPIILFLIVCLIFKTDTQLIFALVISTLYGLVMMAVLVGVLLQIAEDGPLAPSTLFLFIVAGEIIIAGLVHPQEVYCLPSGTIYYVTIPSMYLLLIIYSVCNLNVVSWGTREVAEEKTPEEMEADKKKAEEAKKKETNPILAFFESIAPTQKEKGSVEFSLAGLFRCMFCTQPQEFDEKEHLVNIGNNLVNVTDRLDRIERRLITGEGDPAGLKSQLAEPKPDPVKKPVEEAKAIVKSVKFVDESMWMEDAVFEKTKTVILDNDEETFWVEMLDQHLKPIDEDKAKQDKIAKDLKELRDKMVLSFFMLNALFVTVMFLLQLKKDIIYINWPLGVKSNITYDPTTLYVEINQDFLQLEPIGFVFLIFFAIILCVQFIGMFFHRFETLCHVLSTTSIFNLTKSAITLEQIIERTKKFIRKEEEETLNEAPEAKAHGKARQTLKVLQSELNDDRRSKSARQTLSNRMSVFMQETKKIEDDAALEKAERRRTSVLRRMSSARPSKSSFTSRTSGAD